MRKSIPLLIIITLTLFEILTVNLNAGVNELNLTPPTTLQDGDVLIPHLYELWFDGVNDYAVVGLQPDGSGTPFTVYGWSEITVIAFLYPISPKQNTYYSRAYIMGSHGSDRAAFALYSPTTPNYSFLLLSWTVKKPDGLGAWYEYYCDKVNQWIFTATIFDSQREVTHWLDGVKVYENTVPSEYITILETNPETASLPSSYKRVMLGRETVYNQLPEKFGYFIIYSRALASEELTQIYSQGVVSANGLKVFILPTAFDGSKYVDLSGNNNHAYPYNGPLRIPAETPKLIVLRGSSNTSGLVLRFFPLGSKIYFSDGSYVVVSGDVNPVGLVDTFTVDRTDVVKVVIPRSLLPEFEFVRPEYLNMSLGTAGIPMKLVLEPWGFNAIINRTNNELAISGSESCTVSGTSYVLRLLQNYTLVTPCSTYNLTSTDLWSVRVSTLDYLDIQQLSDLRVNITYVSTSAMCGECNYIHYNYTMALHNITISGTHKYAVLDRFRPLISATLQSRSDVMYYVMVNEYPYMTESLPYFKVIDTVNPVLVSVSAPYGSVLTSTNIKITFENETYVLNAPIPTPPQLIMPHPDGDQAFLYESDVGEGIAVKLYTNATVYTSYNRVKQEHPAGTVLYVSEGSIHYTPSQKYLAIITPDPVIINFSSVIQVFNTSNPMAILLIPPTLLGEWALLAFYVIPIASYVARRSAPLAAVLTVLTSLMIMYVSTAEISKYISAAATAVAIAALILTVLRRSEI